MIPNTGDKPSEDNAVVEQAGPKSRHSDFLDHDVQFFVTWRNHKGDMERGPLPILWDLIESYQIDIFQVSLLRITEDFLLFLEDCKKLQLQLAASFAYMASRLILYKSKMLLPNFDFEEGEKEEERLPPELIQQLLEYRKYQMAAENLRMIENLSLGMYTRQLQSQAVPNQNKSNEDQNQWLEVSLNDLIAVYAKLLREVDTQQDKQKDLTFELDNHSVQERISYLEQLLEKTDDFYFEEIFENPRNISRGELIAVFLAVLELSRQAKIIVRQKANFQKIHIFKRIASVC